MLKDFDPNFIFALTAGVPAIYSGQKFNEIYLDASEANEKKNILDSAVGILLLMSLGPVCIATCVIIPPQ